MNQALIVKLHSIRFSIKMDNCCDLNSFQIKLEQTELIIKDEPEEVAIENSSLDDEYDTSLPTLGIKNLLNTQVEVPSNCKFEMKVEKDHPETSISEETSKSKIKMGNCDDFNSFQVKLEQTELIIKEEPEEVAIENSSLDDEYDTSLPTLAIKDQLLNTQIEVVPSNCKFEMKVDEDHPKTSISEDISKSKMNVGNYDFDALEIKLEHEEVIIKDEPEEVIQNTSSLEIIQFDTIPVTLGIRDRTGNTRIKVDPSICRIEDLLRICTCTVEVIMIPQHVFATKMKQYLGTLKTHVFIHGANKPFQCQQCNKCFTQNSTLTRHALIHKGLKPFKCQQCNKCFTRNSSLKTHLLIHKGLKPFKCQQCNKCFTQNCSLKKHMLIHKGLKPFKCQQCNKFFTENRNLKRHMLIHKGLKPVKCQQCNKCFTDNNSIKRHMFTHNGVKPFKCQQCNKCFIQSSQLKTHLLIHKGLKPFKCQQCNKCFTENSSLQKHLLIHKGLKPFKCQQCNKCFTRSSHLQTHLLIHQGLKPFKCQQCNKCFTQNGSLKEHMLIHKGLKRFKCQQCNKCFNCNRNCKRHMLSCS